MPFEVEQKNDSWLSTKPKSFKVISDWLHLIRDFKQGENAYFIDHVDYKAESA